MKEHEIISPEIISPTQMYDFNKDEVIIIQAIKMADFIQSKVFVSVIDKKIKDEKFVIPNRFEYITLDELKKLRRLK